jgi:hypothetical protein
MDREKKREETREALRRLFGDYFARPDEKNENGYQISDSSAQRCPAGAANSSGDVR